MSIRVVCPNGHVLRVKDSLAGKVGLCPACKARVQVPEFVGTLSEDDIIDVLGPHDPKQDSTIISTPRDTVRGSAERRTPPRKSCSKCNREIASGTHICPFCRTYIANLSDL